MSTQQSAQACHERVMVVDDTPVNRDLLSMLLSDVYTVETAESAEACEAQLESGMMPDVFLLDICMPGKDGYQLCRDLKSDPRWQQIPVIFVSALEQPADRLQAYESGGDDYIVKPIDIDRVRQAVERVLVAGRRQRELEEQARLAAGTAMEAMIHASEQGVLIAFMQEAFRVSSVPDLLEAARKMLEKWGLASSFYYLGGREPIYCGCDPESLEAKLLADAHGGGFTEFRQRLLIDRQQFRILVRNMPVDLPEKNGRLKDHLGVLCNLMEATIRNVEMQQAMRRQRDEILDQVIRRSEGKLDSVRNKVRQHSEASVNALRVMLNRLEDKMFHLGLEEDQEIALRELVNDANATVTELMVVSDEVQHSVDDVLSDLYTLAQRD